MRAPWYIAVPFAVAEALLVVVAIVAFSTWWWGDKTGLSVYRDFFKRGED